MLKHAVIFAAAVLMTTHAWASTYLLSGTGSKLLIGTGNAFLVSPDSPPPPPPPATSDLVNPKSAPWNAICDGAGHPLSQRYATLAAAQAVFPFITSLTQEIDYAALKGASNFAFGADGAENGTASPHLNKQIAIPAGKCMIGADSWLIRKLSGGRINGAGTKATTISGFGSTVLSFDGLWYSEIGNMTIYNTGTGKIAALDVDGNVPGHPYATMGAQANRLPGITTVSIGNQYSFAVCRQGGSGGQCSEMTYDNYHGQGGDFAVYYQNGYNAIDNIFIGGDMQNYPKHGIWLFAGNIRTLGTSFESTKGYTQIINGGCDITANSGGANDTMVIIGNRSESLCFYNGGASQRANITSFSHNPAAFNTWTQRTWALNDMVAATTSGGVANAYRVTTAGASGATQPIWPASGTITDGSVVWTQTPITSVLLYGDYDFSTSLAHPATTIDVRDAKFTVGSPKVGQGQSYGMTVNGSNILSETYFQAQGKLLGIYANSQATTQAAGGGVTYPAASAGMIGKAGTKVIIGGSSTQLSFDGADMAVIGTLPTSCAGKAAGTIWKNSGALGVCP